MIVSGKIKLGVPVSGRAAVEPRDGFVRSFFVAMVWMAVSLAAEVTARGSLRAGGCRLHGLSTGAWPMTRLQWLKPRRSFAFLLFCLCFVLPKEVGKAAMNARARGGKSFGMAPSVKKGAHCVKQPKWQREVRACYGLTTTPAVCDASLGAVNVLAPMHRVAAGGLGYYCYSAQGDRQCY